MNEAKRHKILIVDDEARNIDVLAEALGSSYELFATTDVARAEGLMTAGVDLVLLDVVMPGQDGFDFCRKAKANAATRDIPIIFVTALGDVEDETRGFEAGGVDYIAKPISPATVRARVKTHLDLRAAQKRLEREAETLAENLHLKEDVERLARHDLKTPLGTIISLSQILLEGGSLSDSDHGTVETIESAGYRILEMVNRSLDLFRMEAGTYELRPQAVDLTTLADRVGSDLRPLCQERSVTLRFSSTEGHEAVANAEELLSYSMLANLMKNAIEAAPSGSFVTVSTYVDSTRTGVSIHNQGAVPAAIRADFFRKYASHGKKAGTGLGTYSARLMARTQGGDVEMNTSEATGTTLHVRLPRATQDASKHAAPSGNSSSVLAGRTVLIVDDDEATRFVLRRALSGARRIDEVAGGESALEFVRLHDPDIVLVDAEMPGINGFETVTRMRDWEALARARRRLLVGLSAHDDHETRRRFERAGCDIGLSKPVSPSVLLAAIAGTLPPNVETPVPDERRGPKGATAVEVDSDLMPHMEKFLESRRTQAADLEKAIAAGSHHDAARIAHQLRGGLEMCGFTQAAETVATIEATLQSNDPKKTLEQAKELRDALATIRYRARKGARRRT